jgi:putative ABC transport system ATP-binding protein
LTLIAHDLSKEYKSGDHQLAVLRDVSFTIPQGAFVAIVGPSGSGKTTLLGLLAGLDTPTGGRVLLDGADLTAMDEDERAQLRGAKVGFVFQSFQLISTLTALENVQVPLELRGERGASARASDLLRRVGLGDRLEHFPTQLSGGQQQRVAIARALAMHPELILFDEPTSALDPKMTAEVLGVMADLAQQGETMLVVTHAMNFARRVATDVHVIDQGVIVESGPPAQIFEAPQHAATRELLQQE